MRILVYPHSMELGGSQLNALEIAAAVQDSGHHVVVFAQDGPLVRRAEDLGVDVVRAPDPGRRPSPTVIRALLREIDSRRIDVVHGYEWPPALECAIAARLRPRTRVVATVLSMAIAPFIPTHVPLLVGTEQIRAAELAFGRSTVGLMEPPVDTELNRPGLDLGQQEFLATWSIDDAAPTVVLVSRLAHQLKLEGVLAAMDAAAELTSAVPLQLVIVGDGPARNEVKRHADEVNRGTGRRTVILTGPLEDPRAAYSIADVALGMGGSALRAMAFGKPLVVQGEQGFWKLLTKESLPEFLWQGWYGVGPGSGSGSGSGQELADILAPLLADPGRCERLGAFGLATVRNRFSLEHAARTQVAFYEDVLGSRDVRTGTADVAAAARLIRHDAVRRTRRLLGYAADEDFNARPLAAGRIPRPVGPVAR